MDRAASASKWRVRSRLIVLRDVEVSSQIEQGALAHLVADALGAHEAEGEVLPDAAGTGAPDEHAHTVAGAE